MFNGVGDGYTCCNRASIKQKDRTHYCVSPPRDLLLRVDVRVAPGLQKVGQAIPSLRMFSQLGSVRMESARRCRGGREMHVRQNYANKATVPRRRLPAVNNLLY